MRIGILEICVPNHYAGVQTLALTYSSDPTNKIVIFTTKPIGNLLDFLTTVPGVEMVIKGEKESIATFLARVGSYQLDRLHVNTLSKYFKEMCQIGWQIPIYLTIHNTEECFNYDLYNRTKLLTYKIADRLYRKKGPYISTAFKAYIKEFYHSHYRRRFLRILEQIDGRYLVYSRSLKNYLSNHVDPQKVVVFPFTYSNGSSDLSQNNHRIRICVVGAISHDRRDYDTLLTTLLMNPQWKNRLTIDFLGYVTPESVYLIPKFNKMIEEGYDIIYYKGYVPDDELDLAMRKSDIILVNVYVKINFLQKYGQTKESGALFNMIRSGKPGLFTADYCVEGEIREICIFYSNQSELEQQLTSLLEEPDKLKRLKAKAQTLSCEYTPAKLYSILVDSNK